MKEWWEDFNNPLVKGVSGFALCLFLALNFPVVFLVIVAAALCYVVALVGVAFAYRNRYAIVGKSEIAVRFVRRTFSGFREGCSRAVAHALEEREKRKLLKREKQERLRRYKRKRNRRKREHARRALEQR
jgi:DNA integrity scanning protein DisA with diadenylate cyclase activity